MADFSTLFESMAKAASEEEQEALVQRALADMEKDFGGFLSEATNFASSARERAETIDTRALGLVRETRQTWKNAIANQVVQPLRYLRPENLSDLIAIVKMAEEKKCKLKAAGSGHSFSEVATTTDLLIDTHGLKEVLPLDSSVLKAQPDTSTLVHVMCGIRIRDLNAVLDQRGLALPNMGGYTAQTIVGAFSTGTHGSGISLGPIASFVEALELVSDGGTIYRLEPANGLSDPQKYRQKYPGHVLVQDDDWFRSVVVSMGCMGVIYSVILRVMKKYWLAENRTIRTWEEVKAELQAGQVLRENRHYEVLVNPYIVKGKRTCLVTKRNLTAKPSQHGGDRAHRNFLSQFLASIPGVEHALRFLFDVVPQLIPGVIDGAMKSLKDDIYVDLSYKVLDLGPANNIDAFAAEIGFPLATHLEAAERIFVLAEEMRTLGEVYFTSPISLRFVKASEAYLAMMNGQDTCMIEIPVVVGTYGGREILHKLEDALYPLGGRPHWGMINHLTGSNDLIRKIYPGYGKWLAVYRQLNKNGTFDNGFTARMGFSQPALPQSRRASTNKLKLDKSKRPVKTQS